MTDAAVSISTDYIPPFDRSALTAYLESKDIAYRTHDHPAVFRVEEGLDLKADMPGVHSKNLFLKDKKGKLWLISAAQDTILDLKRAHKVIGSDRLSFGNENLLWRHLGVRPGSVTALGLINDPQQEVTFILDVRLWQAEIVNFHPLENTATTALDQTAFRAFMESLGRPHFVVDFEQMERIV